MKRVLCPKCENYLYFDETKYSEGQSLVFECEHCGKQFSIRLGKSKVKALRKEENLEEEAESHKEEFGYITVIENVFGFKQLLPRISSGRLFAEKGTQAGRIGRLRFASKECGTPKKR